MFRGRVVKQASLFAGMLTLVVVPLGILLLIAPTSDEASWGFPNLQVSPRDLLIGVAVTAMVFAVSFMGLAMALARFGTKARCST